MANNDTTSSHYGVELTYQSKNLTRIEWVALFTLCLAPLIAHLLAGAPRVIYLHKEMPRWHDKLVLYNPVSIVWRYLAITERSVCSVDLRGEEVAAINVIYWTSSGWQGSETEIDQGKSLCVQRPPPARRRLFSGGTVMTIIVAAQGISAAGALLPGPLAQDINSLGTVFFPLAFIGLLRLPAAYWLTDDFIILHPFDVSEVDIPLQPFPSSIVQERLLSSEKRSSPIEQVQIHENGDVNGNDSGSHVMLVSSPRPRLPVFAVRAFYLLFMLFGVGICIFKIIQPVVLKVMIPLTGIVMTWAYLFWLVTGTILMVHQFSDRSKSRSLCVPYLNTRWYKTYTCALCVLALLTTISSALETRRTWDGKYTTRPEQSRDWTCGHVQPSDTMNLVGCLRWVDTTWESC